MTSVFLSPAARADLDDIWDYGSAAWGPDRAEQYLRRIQQIVESTAADPRRGLRCDTIRPGYWKVSAGQHVLFFRRSRLGVDVIRVLHQRMDFERHL